MDTPNKSDLINGLSITFDENNYDTIIISSIIRNALQDLGLKNIKIKPKKVRESKPIMFGFEICKGHLFMIGNIIRNTFEFEISKETKKAIDKHYDIYEANGFIGLPIPNEIQDINGNIFNINELALKLFNELPTKVEKHSNRVFLTNICFNSKCWVGGV
jgi:hypothetical protein